jgi:hypothetical protein
VKHLTEHEKKSHTHNSTFAISVVSCSADSFVVAENSVLRINICGDNPTQTQNPKPLAVILFNNTVTLKI